jgi:cobalamin biosynthesis Co2+ chelatase CbiK
MGSIMEILEEDYNKLVAERDQYKNDFLGLCDLTRRLMDAEDDWTQYDCTINIDKFITPIMERMGQKNAKRTL